MVDSGNDLETVVGEAAADPPAIDVGRALTPFADTERARLVRYLERLDRLLASPFFKGQGKITVRFDREAGWRYQATDEADPDAVEAMLQRLRTLYAPGTTGRPAHASFPRIMELLRAHVTETAEGERLARKLDEYTDAVERILTEPPPIALAMVTTDEHGDEVAREPIAPKDALLDWLYGEYLHDDEERLERLEPWRPLGLHRHVALDTATRLTGLYGHFGLNVVRPVVDEDRLHTAAS